MSDSSAGILPSDSVSPVLKDWTDASWRRRLRSQLLDWFSVHARVLPWRSDPTPYRVWVSEIMCQQTQVATVVPYFERFVARYPTIKALAQSDSDELMRLWEGLGYYRRAASLRRAALQIVAEHGGEFPTAFDDVLALPGIGRYTAGAILSIARNERFPILEGNTRRVFSRWIGLTTPPPATASQRELWAFAEAILPTQRVADRARGPAAINQAAMELGALLCTPKSPGCLVCPVRGQCTALAHGRQDVIPGQLKKMQYESRNEFALLIGDGRAGWLVRQVPSGERFAGLWDFPRVGPPHADNPQAAVAWLRQQLGGTLTLQSELTCLKHAVTRYRITLRALVCRWRAGCADGDVPGGWIFVPAEELARLAMHVTGRKISRLLRSD